MGKQQKSLIALKIFILASVVLLALGMATFSLLQYWSLDHRASLDTAYFMQRLYQASHGVDACRTLLMTEQGQGLVSGRHFEPILAVLLPLVRLYPRVEVLLVFQCLAVASCVPLLALFAKRRGVDHLSIVLFVLSFCLWPLVWRLGSGDFRTLAIVLPFIVGTYALSAAQRVGYLVFVVILALMCREEIPWFILATLPALYMLLEAKVRRKALIPVTALCVLWLGAIVPTLGALSTHVKTFSLVPVALSHLPLNERLTQAALDIAHTGQGIAQSMGPSVYTAFLTPLWSLPLLVEWLGLWQAGGLADLSYAHYLAPAIAVLPVIWLVAAQRLAFWFQRCLSGRFLRGPVVLRSLLGLLLSFQAYAFYDELYEPLRNRVSNFETGYTYPATRTGSPWVLISQVPKGAVFLTDEGFAAPLSGRSYLYDIDEWALQSVVEDLSSLADGALLRSDSPAIDPLMRVGYLPVMKVSGAVLLSAPKVPLRSQPICLPMGQKH